MQRLSQFEIAFVDQSHQSIAHMHS